MNELHDRPMPRAVAEGYANTFYGHMEELDRQAAALGYSGLPGLMAESDQAHAHVRSMEVEVLRKLLPNSSQP